jgi:glycosyltransferase involved in cell wall biosynthesis
MKLLFAIKSMTVPGGGAERVLAEVASGLAARGHDVVIASYDRPGVPDFYEVHASIERIRLDIGSTRPATLAETLRRMRGLRRLALRLRPDVAIGFMHSIYVPMGIALLGTGIPVVASEHIVFGHYGDKPLQNALLRLTPSFVAGMTAISERVLDTFPPGMKPRMTVVPNPVTTAPARLADTVGSGRRILLSVGRLTDQKDHATLISAFALLAGDHPEWDLRIVGEGDLRPMLEARIAAAGLGDRIFLPGSTHDIAAEYSAAQIFVMPSTYESFGLVTAEALAHGLPAIGFADCPGTNELIVDGVNGLLVSGSNRPAALAEGLGRLIRDPALRDSMAAAAPASVRQFALDPIVDRWEDLLSSIVQAPRPAGRASKPA